MYEIETQTFGMLVAWGAFGDPLQPYQLAKSLMRWMRSFAFDGRIRLFLQKGNVVYGCTPRMYLFVQPAESTADSSSVESVGRELEKILSTAGMENGRLCRAAEQLAHCEDRQHPVVACHALPEATMPGILSPLLIRVPGPTGLAVTIEVPANRRQSLCRIAIAATIADPITPAEQEAGPLLRRCLVAIASDCGGSWRAQEYAPPLIEATPVTAADLIPTGWLVAHPATPRTSHPAQCAKGA